MNPLLELRATCNGGHLPFIVKVHENMTITEFIRKNPRVRPEVLGYKSQLPSRLRQWATLEDRRRQCREEKKWAARKLDDHFGVKWGGRGPSDTIYIHTDKLIPSRRYVPPARFVSTARRSWRNSSHSRRGIEIDLEDKRYNAAMEKYQAEKRKAEYEKMEVNRQVYMRECRNPTSLLYSGRLKVPPNFPYVAGMTEERLLQLAAVTTTPPTSADGYEQCAAIYNNLVAYKPHINEALTALKHAQSDAHTFASVSEVLVARFREAAYPLKQLAESGIDKTALATHTGLGWDWQSMHWTIAFLLEQQVLAYSVYAQLPENVTTLLNCLIEVTELVGSKRENLEAHAAHQNPDQEVLQTVILGQSFEEARSAYYAVGRTGPATSCKQAQSDGKMQATVLDQSFEEARSENYTAGNTGEPQAPVDSHAQHSISGFGQRSSTSVFGGGFVLRKPNTTFGQPSITSAFVSSPAPATHAFGLAANQTKTAFCSPMDNRSATPLRLTPAFRPPSALAINPSSNGQNANAKASNMFGNLGTHIKSEKSSNLFGIPRSKPVEQRGSDMFGKFTNTATTHDSASDSSSASQNKTTPDTSKDYTPLAAVGTPSFVNLNKTHTASSGLPDPQGLCSNRDVIAGLTHPGLKAKFISEANFLKSELEKNTVPEYKGLRSLFLVCDCVLEQRKEKWFEAHTIAKAKGVQSVVELMVELYDDIEIMYEWAAEERTVKALMMRLKAASDILDIG